MVLPHGRDGLEADHTGDPLRLVGVFGFSRLTASVSRYCTAGAVCEQPYVTAAPGGDGINRRGKALAISSTA
jgi:hypothetical protein